MRFDEGPPRAAPAIFPYPGHGTLADVERVEREAEQRRRDEWQRFVERERAARLRGDW